MSIKLNCFQTEKDLEQFAYESFLGKYHDNDIRNKRQVITSRNVYEHYHANGRDDRDALGCGTDDGVGDHKRVWAVWVFSVEDA